MGLGALSGWSAAPASSMEHMVPFAVSSALPSVGLIGLGTLCGLLLPRPRFLESAGGRTGAILWSAPPGTALRRLALVFHGAVLIRDMWQHHVAAEVHAALLALWSWLCGCFVVIRAARSAVDPTAKQSRQQQQTALQTQPGGSAAVKQPGSSPPITSSSTSNWHVKERDLAFFKRHCESDRALEGATRWELQMDKEFPTFSYTAWRRVLPSGKAEYKSVTVSIDATAEEFTDFYLDDDVRPEWDGMVTHHDVLENGSAKDRCQVVHWIRSFPFAFISDREYVIARRQFRDANGCIYVCTKGVQHPRAPLDDSVVRMDIFYSMWRSRTVPCPRGSGRPACETVLLHHEQFKIPENLARFAVKAGMGGFVKKMGPAVRAFVDARRARIDPFEADPEAYGVKQLARTSSNTSSLDTVGTEFTDGTDNAAALADPRFPQRAPRRRRQKPKPSPVKKMLRLSLGVAAAVLAVRGGRALPALVGGVSSRLRLRRKQPLSEASPES